MMSSLNHSTMDESVFANHFHPAVAVVLFHTISMAADRIPSINAQATEGGLHGNQRHASRERLQRLPVTLDFMLRLCI